MCWSGPASVGMASLGFGGAIVAKIKGQHPFRCLNLAYFSCMEMLQAITYSVIGICAISGQNGGNINETLTYLSYVHISLQPIFLNLAGLSYSYSGDDLKKWLKIIMPITLIFGLLLLSKMYFHDYFGQCDTRLSNCGSDTCSFLGEWHIAWRFYLNALDEITFFGLKINWTLYKTSIFILPLLYGGWRCSLYNLFFALMTMTLSSNKDEYAAIWCLSSVAFAFIVYIPFINNWMETPLRENELKKKF